MIFLVPKRYFVPATVLYILSFISLAAMAAHALNLIVFEHGEKIFTGVLAVVFGYSAAVFDALCYENAQKRKKVIRRQLFFIFLFYIIMLVDFTLIDDTFGRNIFNVFSWNETAFEEYVNTNTNLIPFETVRLFINGYRNGNLPLSAMLENIVGNLLAFAPMPFFAVCIFKHFDRWYTVFTAVLVSVMTVELLQFLFLTGSSDIDDVILNVSGAMLIYGIIRIKTVSMGLSKITFGVWETVEKDRL